MICDVRFPRVGNERKRCLLDESLFFLSFLLLFIYVGEISERGSPKWMAIIDWLVYRLTDDMLD